MNVTSDSKVANSEHCKSSDYRRLSADAKIIVALIKRQPQKRLELCKSAGVHPSTLSRLKRQLEKKGIVKMTRNEYSLWYYKECPGVWDVLQRHFLEAGESLARINVQKSIYKGRDLETSWRLFEHDDQILIGGIFVSKNSPELVAKARSAGIYFHDNYDALIMTSDQIRWGDRVFWNDKQHEVRDVEERLEKDNKGGYYVGKLVELVGNGEDKTHSLSYDVARMNAQNQTKTFLERNLDEKNITKDSTCSEKAVYCVMYANPSYSILKEFITSDDPVDGVYAVDASRTTPLYSADHTVYGYEESVPVFIYTVDKIGIASRKLESKMEAELRRVCETYPIGTRNVVRLESHRKSQEHIGRITLHISEFCLNYKRSATQ